MKKNFLIVALIVSLIIPIKTLAASNQYKKLNLDEALKEEKIEHDFSNYEENKDQAVIYLFRGNGCGYCRNFLSFLNSIVDEYGKYFRVESYEVWYNENNSLLMKEVSTFLQANASGVPFIIIGDEVFNGYNETYSDAIKEAIMKQYNSKKKYDVMKEMKKANRFKISSEGLVIICSTFVLIVCSTIIELILTKKQNQLLNEKLIKIENKLNNMTKEQKKVELSESKEPKTIKSSDTKKSKKTESSSAKAKKSTK